MNKKLIIAMAALLTLTAGATGGMVGVTAGAGVLASLAQQNKPDVGLSASPLVPVGSGFTYQGRLSEAGAPSNGQYDFVFTLFDAAAGGNQVGNPNVITLTNETVTGGLFNVTLDFGNTAFLGEARWLDIAVRPAGIGGYSVLLPRQPLTPAPYAQSAPWQGVSNKPWLYNPLRNANSIATVDSAFEVGQHNSITIGADGLGLISHFDGALDDLKVTHCNDTACSSASTATIDSSSNQLGLFTSITIGTDGLGLISYYDLTSGDLKVAHCNNVACSSATLSTVDNVVDVGVDTSIAIGADGLGLISYANNSTRDLKVAHCNNTACTSATSTTLDSTGDVGIRNSITIGADGLGLISYYDNSNGDLKTAHCNNAACSSATIVTIDSTGNVGFVNSITIGADGLGLISYQDLTNFDLKAAHCNNIACSSATSATLDSAGSVGNFTSIVIGVDGLGLITYQDQTNGDLKAAHCNNIACSSAAASTIDATGDVGQYPSITRGADGLGLISYLDNTNQNLKTLHCASPLCVSYQNGR